MALHMELAAHRLVTVASVITCCTMALRRPEAQLDLASRATERSEHFHLTDVRRDHSTNRTPISGRALQLSAELARANSYEARCNALGLLAQCPDIDSVTVAQIARYTEADHSVEDRTCAINALSGTRSDNALSVLLELLQDPNIDIATNALQALGQYDGPSVREALIEVVTHGRERLRLPAMDALAQRQDPRVVGYIASALKTTNLQSRDYLIGMLGTSHDPHALPILRTYLDEGPRSAQYAAIAALGTIGGTGAVDALETVLTEKPGLAAVAVEALGRTNADEAREVLFDVAGGSAGPQAELAALRALSGQDGDDVRALMVRTLEKGDANHAQLAVEYLARTKDPGAVPLLSRLAQGGGAASAQQAVMALARIGSEEARESLLRLSNSPGPVGDTALSHLSQSPEGAVAAQKIVAERIRRGDGSAAFALDMLAQHPSQEVSALIAEAARSKNPALATQAIGLLGQLPTEEHLGLLINLADTGATPTQRAMALSALSQRTAPSARARIVAGLQDESPEVRVQAVQGILESGAPNLEEHLMAATRDASPEVQGVATQGLSALGTKSALARIEEVAGSGNPQTAAQALHVLTNISPEKAAPLVERIASAEDPAARVTATQLANMFPPETSVRIIRAALQNTDNPDVLRGGISALSQSGLSEGQIREILGPLVKNPEVETYVRSIYEPTLMAGRSIVE